MFNAKTLEEIDEINLADLETIDKSIISSRAAHIYLSNIKDYRENCKTTIEQRNKLTLQERTMFDTNLIQKLTQNYETKIEMINDNLQTKENEIEQLKKELEENPNQELQFILDQKQADLADLQKSTANELNQMESEYKQQLAKKEADRKLEIEELKMANNNAMSEKEKEMQQLMQELEDYKSKQEKMIEINKDPVVSIDHRENYNQSDPDCFTKLYN